MGRLGQYGRAMRRGLVHALAWLLATGAAVTLSWWGVRTVLAGTVYDPPRALPITATTQGAGPVTSATVRPEPSPTTSRPSPGASGKSPGPTATGTGGARKPTVSPSASGSAVGRVKGYNTEGGRAVFDLRDSYASLVSATPAANWSMQLWKTETWIRVDFSSGSKRVSVFCTWHDTAPRVEITTY